MSEIEIEHMSKSKFYVSINKISEFVSKEVTVPGNLWSITFTRAQNQVINTNKANEDVLFVNLNWKNDDEKPSDWACVASLSVKLMRSTNVANSLERNTGPFVFDAENKVCDKKITLEWNDLLLPENGYKRNDSFKFEIEINAGPIQIVSSEKWLKFDVIEKCCDKSLTRKFRLTLNTLHESNQVCSPEVHLNNSVWRIVVTKDERLTVYLLKMDSAVNALDFPMLCVTSLKSFDQNIDSVTNIMNTTSFDTRIETHMKLQLFSMPWTNVVDALKKFVKNGSFNLEIEMKMNANDDNALNTGFTLECSICMQSLLYNHRSVSATICGHVFCTDCIRARLFNVIENCPECKRPLNLTSLCIINLPVKLIGSSKFTSKSSLKRGFFEPAPVLFGQGFGQSGVGNTQTTSSSFGSLAPAKLSGLGASNNTFGQPVFGGSTTSTGFGAFGTHQNGAPSGATQFGFGNTSTGNLFGSASSINVGTLSETATPTVTPLFGSPSHGTTFGAIKSDSTAPISTTTSTASAVKFGSST